MWIQLQYNIIMMRRSLRSKIVIKRRFVLHAIEHSHECVGQLLNTNYYLLNTRATMGCPNFCRTNTCALS